MLCGKFSKTERFSFHVNVTNMRNERLFVSIKLVINKNYSKIDVLQSKLFMNKYLNL